MAELRCGDENSSDSFFDDPIETLPTKAASVQSRVAETTPQPQPLMTKRRNTVFSDVTNEDRDLSSSPEAKKHRLNATLQQNTLINNRKRSPKIVLREKTSGIRGFPCLSDTSVQKSLTVLSMSMVDGTLTLRCSADGKLPNSECTVYLQDQWANSEVRLGSRINLIGAKKWGEVDWLIDDTEGVLIVESNTLVSATSVSQSLFCARKAILNERFRGGSHTNKAMLMGSIIHELFQISLSCSASQLNTDWILSQWKHAVIDDTEALVALVALKFTPNSFLEELKPYAEVIVSWVRKHMFERSPLVTGSIADSVADIEENVWMPLLGIKGKIDVTLKTSKFGVPHIEPLELKTGKSSGSSDHVAQVLLYCMMMSSLNDEPLKSGSLLYLKDGMEKAVEPRAAELKGVLALRNTIAHYASSVTASLPGPLSDPRLCSHCDHAVTCSLMMKTKLSDSYPDEVSGKMSDFADSVSAHLSQAHRDYFRKWTNWIQMEWSTAVSRAHSPSAIWTKPSDERESSGQCLRNLRLSKIEPKRGVKGFTLRFSRSDELPRIFSCGDMVVVSTDERPALVMGAVLEVSNLHICVSSERILPTSSLYHIDRHESMSVYAMNMSNVARFMVKDDAQRISRLRSLIIDMEPPESGKIPTAHVILLKPLIKKLNPEQGRAIVKAIMSKDFSLIEGLPGSGKSTTIAVLIQCFLAMGQSVLFTAYTHSAVDNLLAKLVEDVSPHSVLRLGRQSSVKAELAHVTMDAKLKDIEGDRYVKTREILQKTPLVAASCLAISSHSLFSWRSFDVCVVDEASLVLESTLLAPISAAKRFVLVGDAKQLSPLVQNKQARSEGMSVSLFERLAIHNQFTVSLTSQYRMNSVISRIASALFYDNRLICANEVVSNACLDSRGLQQLADLKDPVRSVLATDLPHSVVFVNTNAHVNSEYKVSSSGRGALCNNGEANLIVDYCRKFIKMGVRADDIGVMCTYRHQVVLIREMLADYGIEVNTIDQYQGRDKSVILWSLVWTSDGANRSELFNDGRRVNVALTRAKHKLVIVGCAESMKSIDLMREAVEKIDIVVDADCE